MSNAEGTVGLTRRSAPVARARWQSGVGALVVAGVLVSSMRLTADGSQGWAGYAAAASQLASSVSARCLVSPSTASAPSTGGQLRGGGGIRPLNQAATDLFEHARARSVTVRKLARTIESSNIVVFVRTEWPSAGGPAARMNWTAEALGLRYVAVTIDPRQGPNRGIELLGHELRHVAELAAAPWVHSAMDMQKLYEDIGQRNGAGGAVRSFETVAARDAELQVHHDLSEAVSPADTTVAEAPRPRQDGASLACCC